MLDELRQIVMRRAGRLDLAPLRERFGESLTLQRPAEAFEVAQLLCRLAVPRLMHTSTAPSKQGADVLIRFIAQMPEDVAATVRAVPAFVPPAERAWLEPQLNPFVALACTVQDVWAHLAGLESEEDEAIASALLWHTPRTAYDHGCGAGHFAHLLAAAGVEVDGFEVDPLKRAFYEYRAKACGLSARMHLGRRRDSYDMVLAINVLDHLEDPLSAIAALQSLVPAGNVLCTLAAFPKDGWHQSEAAAVTACGHALWTGFTLSDYREPLAPWMDCWVRRDGPVPAASLLGQPRMNPGSTFQEGTEGQVVLHANRFYSTPVALDMDTTDVCRRFDGMNTVAAIAEQVDVDPEALLGLCRYLQQNGHLYWSSDDSPRRAAVAHGARSRPLEPHA